MTRRALGLVVGAAAVAAAGGCESASGRASVRPGVPAVAAPTAAAEVAVLDAPPEGPYQTLGEVAAFSDARYEHRVEVAERLALAELRRVAGEIGANAVIGVEREVVEMQPDPVGGGVTASFEDSQRNLLRPGGEVTAERPIWRVRLTGVAIVTGGQGGTP